MRLVIYALLITGTLFFLSPEYAHAKNWKRVRGRLVMTYFETNLGDTISVIPPQNRFIDINRRLDRRSSERGVKSQCSDNRAVKQRVCFSSWTYEVQGLGTCSYLGKMILNNFFSSSSRVDTFFESAFRCPGGIEGYAQYRGTLNYSR